jgi:glyoxylase I family protein
MSGLTGVAHLSLSVRNLRRSELWYRDLFGFERVSSQHQERFNSVVLRDPGSSLTLSLHEHQGAGTARFDESRTGLDHIAFGVANRSALEEWEGRLRELGIEHSPIVETSFGSVLVFRDIDYIQLEFVCPDKAGSEQP